YERFGPVFTIRILHGNVVFMLGPEANHHMTVSHAANFSWRDGHLGDMIPLLGDGLLTIDGDFHRRSRMIMLPAFHRDQIAKTQAVMDEEVARGIAGWREGERVDLYAWTRVLALRIAGHDTTTSTVAFRFHELARDGEARARVVEDLAAGSTAELELAMDETLRLYPPAWIGPRRALEPFEFAGVQVPAGIPVNYC